MGSGGHPLTVDDTAPDGTAPDGDFGSAELERLVDRVPEGWSRVMFHDRSYGLTRTTHTGGRSVEVYAEELGGPDVVSANVWRLSTGLELRPCEMPAATVFDFLAGWTPATTSDASAQDRG